MRRRLVVGLAAVIAIAGLASSPATAAPVGDWQRVAPMNVGRAGHSMVVLRNGKVLVTGGWVDPITIEPIASAEVYDPRTDTWSTVAPMHVAKRYHQSVLLHSGRVFVYGQGGGEIYTPWTDRWRRVAPTLQDRDDYGWAITLLQNGEVLLLGGAEVPEVEPIGEIFTPWANSWRETAVNPGIGACCFPTIVTLPSGRVLAHGGYMTQGVPAASSEYWPKRDRWQATFDAPGMTDGNNLVVLASGTAFLAGGVALCCSPTPDQNDAWLYDAQTHTWIDTGPMHLARQGHVTVALANGDAVVAAGFARTQATFFTERPRSAELYDASTGTWSWAGPTVFLHHGGAAAVRLRDGRVLLTGGTGGFGTSAMVRGAEVYVPA